MAFIMELPPKTFPADHNDRRFFRPYIAFFWGSVT
jgi:hypothetical protein